MNLEVFVLGTGGMMPLPHRFLTSVLVRRDGDLLLFDCGEGTQVALRSLNLRWKKISSIFISHTHADHVTGLPGILMLSSQVDRDEPLYIYGPPKIKDYIESSKKVLEMYINYPIIVKEIEDPTVASTIVTNENYSITTIPLDHTKPCVGYVLQEHNRPGEFFPKKAIELGVPVGPLFSRLQKGEDITLEDGRVVTPSDVMGPPRKGRKFGFITDTKYHQEYSLFVKESDLLICEGMFTKEMEEDAAIKKHMSASQAAKIGKAAGVKKLGLIHYSPRYTNRELKLLQKEAAEIYAPSFLCRDGMEIHIPLLD